MALDISQVATLVGAQKIATPNVFDLVTGNNAQSVASAGLRGLLNQEPASNLTDRQQSSLSTLESFINENVDGEAASKLLGSLAALQGLLELNNTPQGQLDPIFALVTSNEGLTNSFNLGALLDIRA